MKFKLEDYKPGTPIAVKDLPKQRIAKGKLFLSGPTPLEWLEKCASLNGKCLAVGVHIWWCYYIGGKKLPLKVQGARLKALGVSRHSLYRALQKMKQAGLIHCVDKVGASALITILDVELGS